MHQTKKFSVVHTAELECVLGLRMGKFLITVASLSTLFPFFPYQTLLDCLLVPTTPWLLLPCHTKPYRPYLHEVVSDKPYRPHLHEVVSDNPYRPCTHLHEVVSDVLRL